MTSKRRHGYEEIPHRQHIDEEGQPEPVASPHLEIAARSTSDIVNDDRGSDDENLIYRPHSLLLGRALLLLVAFLYGTLSVTLRGVYALPNPPSASALSTVRGWMAVLCFAPFLWMQLQQKQKRASAKAKSSNHGVEPQQAAAAAESTSFLSDTTTHPKEMSTPLAINQQQRPLWWVATELAFWNFGAQGLQNVGLLYISSARAAFFTQTSVVLTPVISAVAGHHVHGQVWGGCAVALSGLVLLSGKSGGDEDDTDDNIGVENSGGSSGGLFSFGIGDLLCLGGALSWSLYIYRLSHCGTYDEIRMQAIKTVILAAFYTVWFGVASVQSETGLWLGYASGVTAWLLLFYSALGPGTVADVIQQKGQAAVTASEANVILSMEPLFTALLGRVLLGEATSTQEKMGGGLIIIAALIASNAASE